GWRKREASDRVGTGSVNLDGVLGGGIESWAMTEFYGEFGSGKSQICHTLCCTVQMPRGEGGLDGGAIYIDTEGTFRPERVAEIARARGLDAQEVRKRKTVARAYTRAHQEQRDR